MLARQARKRGRRYRRKLQPILRKLGIDTIPLGPRIIKIGWAVDSRRVVTAEELEGVEHISEESEEEGEFTEEDPDEEDEEVWERRRRAAQPDEEEVEDDEEEEDEGEEA